MKLTTSDSRTGRPCRYKRVTAAIRPLPGTANVPAIALTAEYAPILTMRHTRGFSLRSFFIRAEKIARACFQGVAPHRRLLSHPAKLIVIAALAPLLVSCANTLTADDIYERENELILAYDTYEQNRRLCQEIGGGMQIVGVFATRIRRNYTAQDYRLARCVKL